MVVREPMGMRKTMLAGAVALALTGTGVALAWAADSPSPTPSPSQSAPGNSGKAPGQNKPEGQNKPDKAQRAQPLHGEGVVKNPDGTFQTILEQRGTVESVSSTAITVKSEDGFSQAYAVNGDTRITRIPAAAPDGSGNGGGPGANANPSPGATPGAMGDDGKRLKPTDGTIADIATGDTVRISGVKDGGTVTAKRIVEGAGEGPGMGMGRGHAPGHGHGPGKQMGNGNGNGNDNGNDDSQDDLDS